MNGNFKKLKKLLEELFQLDQADLDFGIYRIMNQKRDEITTFLEKDLLPQVKDAFSGYKSSDKSVLEDELQKTVQSAKDAGFDPEQSPKVLEIREKLSEHGVDTTALENEVYSDLYNFFKRYYHEGDFLGLRRYKEEIYAIPYEGEEVKLHWANHDQYYIKSTEYFTDYTFKLSSDRRVHFKIVNADTEKDNIKAQNGNERRFVLCEDNPVQVQDKEMVICFEYRPDSDKRKQNALNDQAVQDVLATQGSNDWFIALSQKYPTEKNPHRTLLEKHLTDYTARNTFDYFIHKNLGGFLRRELDFFIKNEIMHLDDIENETARRVEQYLNKIKVIRKIAHKIIEFLAQLENFQKKLWLKKKFVVETNYCVTLDHVPEELYDEIIQNDTQREEWVKLFAIDEIKGDLHTPAYSEPLTIEFLKAHHYLVVDTKFFECKFIIKLISRFKNIDELCDGVLIHSENFQALNLLGEKYYEQVKCIYIDPPYNTGKDGFPYKDSYQHSSWLSMIVDRISLSIPFLKQSGGFFVSIDEKEHHNLRSVTNNLFGIKNLLADFVWIAEGNFDNQAKIKMAHEYILSYAIDESNFSHPPVVDPSTAEGSKLFRDEIRNTIVKNGPKNPVSAIELPAGFPASFEKGVIKCEDLVWPQYNEDIIVSNYCIENTVVAKSGWSSKSLFEKFIQSSMSNVLDTKGQTTTFVLTITGAIESVKERSEKQSYVTSIIKGVGTIQSTSSMLDDMSCSYPHYPKPTKLVSYLTSMTGDENSITLDYFAGSGTTGHAVINLNREDKGKRKYILIEMGDYFNDVLKPRIAKVIYSDNWKDGKPSNHHAGISHMFKYIRLESYEDTLNNLELKRTDKQKQILFSDTMSDQAKEDYMLSYMLDVESRDSASLLNIDQFEDPFNYKLNISIGSAGETKPVNVDLVETFNYLVGLTVSHIDNIRGFRVIEGTNPDKEKVLIIWRNLKEKSNEHLDDFFNTQEYNAKDMEYDLIYVNGDNNLENLKKDNETWKVRLIEQEFKRLMFDVQDI